MSNLIHNPNQLDLCPICTAPHTRFERCDYDHLVSIIHTLKKERVVLLSINRKLGESNQELLETARNFQNVIKNVEPELKRLLKIEANYKKKTNGTADVSSKT